MSKIPEIVAFVEALLRLEPDEAVDLLTNRGEGVLDRWYGAAKEKEILIVEGDNVLDPEDLRRRLLQVASE